MIEICIFHFRWKVLADNFFGRWSLLGIVHQQHSDHCSLGWSTFSTIYTQYMHNLTSVSLCTSSNEDGNTVFSFTMHNATICNVYTNYTFLRLYNTSYRSISVSQGAWHISKKMIPKLKISIFCITHRGKISVL